MDPIRFVNPRTDETFVQLVHAIAAEGVASAEELQARLRESYPGAVVRERGLSAEAEPIWYVYRDGRWEPGDAPTATSSAVEEDLRVTTEAVKSDAQRLVEIESEKERIKGDDARRVSLATEATDIATRVVEEARIEESLAEEALEEERLSRRSAEGDEIGSEHSAGPGADAR